MKSRYCKMYIPRKLCAIVMGILQNIDLSEGSSIPKIPLVNNTCLQEISLSYIYMYMVCMTRHL